MHLNKTIFVKSVVITFHGGIQQRFVFAIERNQLIVTSRLNDDGPIS